MIMLPFPLLFVYGGSFESCHNRICVIAYWNIEGSLISLCIILRSREHSTFSSLPESAYVFSHLKPLIFHLFQMEN